MWCAGKLVSITIHINVLQANIFYGRCFFIKFYIKVIKDYAKESPALAVMFSKSTLGVTNITTYLLLKRSQI